MSELRREPVTRTWVVVTTDHPKGPSDYLPFKPAYRPQTLEGPCPFCPGNEGMTPKEVYSVREKEGWSVRVVPNKFPFFHIEGGFDRRAEGMYDVMEGIGAHEIVVESPRHEDHLGIMEPEQIGRVLLAFRARLVDLEKDRRFQQFLIVKNHPGVFNPHPHSHILAMSVVPKRIDEEIWGTLDYYQRKERCIFCDMLKEETHAKRRVILETLHFLLFTPFASRYPFETWIMPKKHDSDFHHITPTEMEDLSRVLRFLFLRYGRLLSDPPYSLVLHTSPVQGRFHRPEYHWHLEVRLRIGLREGFEWGTGFFVNPTPPEEAARYIREVGME